jgi:hypothetical protein
MIVRLARTLALAHELLMPEIITSEFPMSIQHQFNAIDRDLMTNIVGGTGSALARLAAACPTPESFAKSAECKAADAHYIAVVKAITRPAAAAASSTVAPDRH